MKIKSTAQLFGVGLGTVLGSLALISAPAFSATLINEGSDETAFKTKYDITRIGEVECKAGRGRSAENCAFGIEGASADVQDSLLFTWENGREYDYTLTWNPITNEADFTFFALKNPDHTSDSERLLNYTFASTEFDNFNAFGLITKVDTTNSNMVDGNTTITLGVNTVEFVNSSNNSVLSPQTLNTSVSSTSLDNSGQVFNKLFYIINDDDRADGVEIGKMTGTFSLNWSTINPQEKNANARVSFELKLFDPPGTSSTVTTPEPTTILGLLGVGTLGLVGRKRKIETK